MKKHKNIMVMGTASSAGKSLLVTGLCRVFYQDGYKVAPFKSQNMSLNSFITDEGLEMGRAQVVQAEACNILPKVMMNPILLKPTANNSSQIILHGKAITNMNAKNYFEWRKGLRVEVEKAYAKIKEKYEISVIEGAGSPAEINLKKDDLVNTGMAQIANSPCILVADIDRGGVFASVYGTLMLLPKEEREMFKGVIINKFRGDVKILEPGLKQMEDLIGIPVLGVVPYYEHNIEEEDSVTDRFEKKSDGKIKIKVIKLPHMSNFTDFDPFKMYEDVEVSYVKNPKELRDAHMIIIPGSKNTISDMQYLQNKGFSEEIIKSARENKLIMGICGGFQILGRRIEDPNAIESKLESINGLGLLDLVTTMEIEKETTQYNGKIENKIDILDLDENIDISGYEIHQGRSKGDGNSFLTRGEYSLGMVNNNIIGTYLHGIFNKGIFVEKLINKLGSIAKVEVEVEEKDYKTFKEKEYDKLAKILRKTVDIESIYKIMEGEEVGLRYSHLD